MDANQLNEIERRVQEAIKDAMEMAAKNHSSSRQWTFGLQCMLTTLGREMGFKVRGAQPDRRDFFEGGWLWDHTWIEIRDEELISVPLAFESEWNPDLENEILWDFQKLMVSRAALRVMVINCRDAQVVKNSFERMIETVRNYSGTNPGDRYLLSAWNYGANEGVVFRAHVA